MLVQLQGEDEKTCVTCSTINALRHFGMDAPYEQTAQELKLPWAKGSYAVKAAKWLRRNYPVIAVRSRPPHLIRDPWGAAIECANRWAGFLADGYVGILDHQTSSSNSHAVVLYGISQVLGEPVLHCYDSAQRHKNGLHTYRALNFVWWLPEGIPMAEWLEMDEEHRKGFPIHPTGRDAYFVKPVPIEPLTEAPVRRPFRSRKQWAGMAKV